MSITVVYVLYNTLTSHGAETLKASVQSLLDQNQFSINKNLYIKLYDNASNDETAQLASQIANENQLQFIQNQFNLGFAAAYNKAVGDFLASDSQQFVAINSDVVLESSALHYLGEALIAETDLGVVCPRLLQAKGSLVLDSKSTIDAYGMRFTRHLRHFNQGIDQSQSCFPEEDQYVFGASGACMMFTREFIKGTDLGRLKNDSSLFKKYPFLVNGYEQRPQVFDEAFMAYREDADLAWRSQLRGFKCKLVYKAWGMHQRVVRSDNRKTLDSKINCWSVRNRFLLQINNYFVSHCPQAFFLGVLWRNLVVILGVLVTEHKSVEGLIDVVRFFRRGLEIRKHNKLAMKVSNNDMRVWFEE